MSVREGLQRDVEGASVASYLEDSTPRRLEGLPRPSTVDGERDVGHGAIDHLVAVAAGVGVLPADSCRQGDLGPDAHRDAGPAESDGGAVVGQGDGCAPRQQPAQPMAGAVEFEGTEGGPRRECRADPNAAENRVEPARAVLAETACPQPDPPCGVLGAPVVAEHSG